MLQGDVPTRAKQQHIQLVVRQRVRRLDSVTPRGVLLRARGQDTKRATDDLGLRGKAPAARGAGKGKDESVAGMARHGARHRDTSRVKDAQRL
jgi:hypothetical protein